MPQNPRRLWKSSSIAHAAGPPRVRILWHIIDAPWWGLCRRRLPATPGRRGCQDASPCPDYHVVVRILRSTCLALREDLEFARVSFGEYIWKITNMTFPLLGTTEWLWWWICWSPKFMWCVFKIFRQCQTRRPKDPGNPIVVRTGRRNCPPGGPAGRRGPSTNIVETRIIS